jgi:3-oxoacyl-[acyl-carrier-protein] synthase III
VNWEGHLPVAKWIFSIKVFNFHQENDYIFQYTCSKGQLTVAQWLYILGEVNIHAHVTNSVHLQTGLLNRLVRKSRTLILNGNSSD